MITAAEQEVERLRGLRDETRAELAALTQRLQEALAQTPQA
jgi:diadenosine tetraphosphate (Ap4A) HIT family hydrolase